MWCDNYTIFILSLILSIETFGSSQDIDIDDPSSDDWDYILYSQRWPVTACAEWEEEKNDNTCNMPKDKTTWTVHGLWPTKTGTNGPNNCPSAIHFDPDALIPIMDDLQSYWVNVEANTKPNSFWKHEWDKHGTCAITAPLLDSIQNYFQQGLDWNKQYNLSHILNQGKVVPGTDGYTIDEIYNAIKSYTNKEPTIQCVVDLKTKESMISEIRMCFNRDLELIDCTSSNSDNKNRVGAITNCSQKKAVMYFADVPVKGFFYEMDYFDNAFKQHLDEQMYYMNMYRLLRFLIWFTT